MKKTIALLMLITVFLVGCENDSKINVEQNDQGFYDKENDIQYLACNQLAVRPVTVTEEYATDGQRTYYKIHFEDPKRFICDSKEDISFVYRASTVEDITINNFNPISAYVYREGKTSLWVDTFYCEQKYLDEEDRREGEPDDSELVYTIRDALIEDERVKVSENLISREDEYYIRLMSADYPGLYYTVVFFTDINEQAYLKDRGTGDIVIAPDNIKARMIK